MNKDTHQTYAIKVIKNHPEYIKQAALERKILEDVYFFKKLFPFFTTYNSLFFSFVVFTYHLLIVSHLFFYPLIFFILILYMLQLIYYDPNDTHRMIRLVDHFVYCGHNCFVTEMLGVDLYNVMRQNKFHGFSLNLVSRV